MNSTKTDGEAPALELSGNVEYLFTVIILSLVVSSREQFNHLTVCKQMIDIKLLVLYSNT